MDRVEKPKKNQSRYANEPDVSPWDEPLLETPTGRADDRGLSARGTPMDADVRSVPVGAQSRREVTGDAEPGTSTDRFDGLDDLEEEVRRLAEDSPTGEGREDAPRELPAFERGLTAPKV